MTGLGRYLRHFTPHWPALLGAAALMAVSAAIPGAAVLVLQQALNAVVDGGGEGLGRYALLFAGLYAAGAITGVARTRITKGVAWRVTSALRRALHGHHLALSPREQASTGERIAALTHDVDELQYGVSAVVTAFRNPLTLLVLAVTAWRMAPGLVPWAAVLLPIVLLPAWWGGRRLRALGAQVRDARAALVGLAQEQLAGLRTVQAHAAETREAARFAAVEEADRAARLRMDVERVVPGAVVELLAAGAVGLLLWVGGRQVVAGTLEPGGLVGFAVAVGLMNRPLVGLSEVWSLLQRSLAALEKVYATLDREPAVREPEAPRPLPEGPLDLAWDDVSVDYGEGPVLAGATLHVRAGELVALVGATGAGKSTLLRLLARHLDPDAGVVRVGGVDVRELSIATLRRAVAVVAQDGFLFARTIAENVALGRPDASREAIAQALRLAGARFVDELPRGVDTPLDELGQRLSGGERQRLCLARALLVDAPVLLLDEATNQIDAETERDVLATLHRVRGERAVVLVAHNLQAVRDADRIAVVDGGRIVEEGSHDALLRARGRYADLWSAQAGERSRTRLGGAVA